MSLRKFYYNTICGKPVPLTPEQEAIGRKHNARINKEKVDLEISKAGIAVTGAQLEAMAEKRRIENEIKDLDQRLANLKKGGRRSRRRPRRRVRRRQTTKRCGRPRK
jgi:hypothetical protein